MAQNRPRREVTPGDATIECEDLTTKLGNRASVDRVSFSIQKRSVFRFLATNGSGKTTVIRILCGIVQPPESGAGIGYASQAVPCRTGRSCHNALLPRALQLQAKDRPAAASYWSSFIL